MLTPRRMTVAQRKRRTFEFTETLTDFRGLVVWVDGATVSLLVDIPT